MVGWFVGIYFCPAGTTEKPCNFQVTKPYEIKKLGKHVLKEHNLHYAWFAGERKHHKCGKCSASSDDLEVIRAHDWKMHGSNALTNKFQGNPSLGLPSSGLLNNGYKQIRSGYRKPPKAKKALYMDIQTNLPPPKPISFTLSYNQETTSTTWNLHSTNPCSQKLPSMPIFPYSNQRVPLLESNFSTRWSVSHNIQTRNYTHAYKEQNSYASPENCKLYASILSLRRSCDDNNNFPTVESSPKSGLTSVEEAIRGLQNRVHAGAFQPGTYLHGI